MADTAFDDAFTRLIGLEGGYVNDPRDPGGETKFGISRRSYPDEDIAGLTLERAKALARRDFWAPCSCDEWPAPVAAAVFDLAYNAGPRIAIRCLQSAVAEVTDGVIGPATRAAVAAADPILIAVKVNVAGLEYRTNLAGWATYGRGWTRRVIANILSLQRSA